ncbi:MAG: iron permease [Zetaproteobacteria bacterium CG12_big_fil_rev_8_21_14_0_65_55_1124]|nr:MAG: iron permease [Zetaproteobacteria bacterium CG1_02_55_237]PIS20406.1 MAG: iron permease [Zetaproteobacteria bacterium CG08_land_8_20_14_0_20_55_17]PIW42602.1 MAG: iron permease [Zetaproteobacteria bacterium CG12_big_fil_rev_8_21_14_0_65_55_1124]PIY54208.1 MAG: iron permease [Zetaproteobacteria bacterium CG_4_10_14_0_8_um_filter_55_43]PIZ38363.1 MAG: iron permease [Zetaproteobacteria bacterium CG_4_10_14_0_2_um_filter_55_20]PJB81148.1 MAG: iron permease [Zetaproteobacteria bacterium CG_
MTSALIIVFREMLEMALVLGVLFAATKGMRLSRQWIGAGIGAGIVGAVLFALFMEEIEGSANGDGEFIFNAAILGIASALIAWTVVWMSSHGREMAEKMRRVGQSVMDGDAPRTALAVVAAAAVLREGGEAVFFLFGAAQTVQQDGASVLMGAGLGVLLGGITGYVIYRGLVRIPLRHLFGVIGWVLIVLAAGMASQAVENLVMIDMLPALVDPLWNTSAWLPQSGMIGEVLRVMTGYSDQPSGMQMLVFVLALVLMALLNRYVRSSSVRPAVQESPAAA